VAETVFEWDERKNKTNKTKNFMALHLKMQGLFSMTRLKLFYRIYITVTKKNGHLLLEL